MRYRLNQVKPANMPSGNPRCYPESKSSLLKRICKKTYNYTYELKTDHSDDCLSHCPSQKHGLAI